MKNYYAERIANQNPAPLATEVPTPVVEPMLSISGYRSQSPTAPMNFKFLLIIPGLILLVLLVLNIIPKSPEQRIEEFRNAVRSQMDKNDREEEQNDRKNGYRKAVMEGNVLYQQLVQGVPGLMWTDPQPEEVKILKVDGNDLIVKFDTGSFARALGGAKRIAKYLN